MLKRYRKQFNILCFLVDLLAVTLCSVLAYWVRDGIGLNMFHLKPLFPISSYVPVFILAALALVGSLFAVGAYRVHPLTRLSTFLINNAKAVLLTLVLTLALAYVLRLNFVSRTLVILFLSLFLALSSLFKYWLSLGFAFQTKTGSLVRVLVIVGCTARARQIAELVLAHREWGLSLRGFFSERKGGGSPQDMEAMQRLGLPCLGMASDLPRAMEREVIDAVVFAVDSRSLRNFEDLCLTCEDMGVDVLIAANLFPHLISNIRFEQLDEIPVLHFTTTPQDQVALFIKRLLDISGSLTALILLSPLLLLFMALIRMTSPGPVFFRQERMGLNGRRFTLYKFRTMVKDAEKIKENLSHLNEADGPVFKIRNDPRITPLGRILRKTSVDELPQFWNVLRGEMSLVGPRPPIPAEVEHYERWQRRRLSMRPGLTCLWQVSGRSELDFDQWMKLDLEYIDKWGLALDLKIILKTIPAVLSGRGAA